MSKVLFLVFWLLPALFWGGNITTINLSNAVELALQNNQTLKQYRQNVKIAQDQYNQSIADLAIPTISANGNFSYLDPDTVQRGIVSSPSSYVAIPGAPGQPLKVVPSALSTNTNVFADNYSAGITITKPLFAGGKLVNGLNLKKILLDQARYQLNDQIKVITTSVKTSFYNLFMLNEKIHVQLDLAKSFKNQRDSMLKNYNAGLASENDFYKIDVAYKSIYPALLTLSNGLALAKSSFAQTTGISGDDFELIGDLMEATNVTYPDIPETNAFELVSSNDVTLYGLNVSIESAKISKAISFAGQLPTLAASFNYNYNYKVTNSSDPLRYWQPAWTAGLQLSIPLDSLLPVSHPAQSVKEMDDTLEKLNSAKKQYLDGLLLTLRTQRYQIDQTYQTLLVQNETIHQSELNLAALRKQYQAGTASFQDQTDAEVALNQARINYLQSIYDYYNAVIKYNQMVGTPSDIRR